MSAPKRLAMKMVPMAEMIVDATSPHRRWKPPLADICAICVALVKVCFLSGWLFVVGVVWFIGCGFFGLFVCGVWGGVGVVCLYGLFICFV